MDLKNSTGAQLWKKAKTLIPGGNQLLSKRAEMFLPDLWPAYYNRASGIDVWDLDGTQYKDFTMMGIGACILGFADPDVNAAVKHAIDYGSMTTLNCPEEVELAELLCELHPWAQMVRYSRSGGEAMAIAVRIGRAASDKSTVAFCGYHGWSDWYLATNLSDANGLNEHLLPGLEPLGVPPQLQGTILPFAYNKIEELEKLVAAVPDIGVIVVETLRDHEPEDNFLQKVRDIATRIGAVLVFDEITIGWRLTVGGAHLKYGVNPDIAVFAKAMGNGFPICAIVGRRDVMDAAQKTFISSTFWTERIGPTAALATIKKLQEQNVPAHVETIGQLIGDGWKQAATAHGLKIKVMGPNALVAFSFDYGGESQAIRTLFTQEMLKRGYLASSSVYVSLAHTPDDVRKYLAAVDETFGIIKSAIDSESVLQKLEGPVAHSGFKRLT